jgi:choline dehydrogenase-like flavoprotein
LERAELCRRNSPDKNAEIVSEPSDQHTHYVKNLFLCDGSSLVTSGRGPPTMTSQALAYRVADRITALAKRDDLLS